MTAQFTYALLCTLGIGFFSLAWWQLKKTSELLQNGAVSPGKVVQLLAKSDSDGTTYTPVFEYTDSRGILQQYTSKISSSPPAFQIGDRVSLAYYPGDTNSVRVVGYWGLYRWSIICLAIGAPLLIIGGGYFLYLRAFEQTVGHF